ncbi:MAG: hypothetical protein PUH31_07670, partial [Prevotella stercorea]|uniref:hypothetical protein n=1 Tax=Leyella stercorea TaxID=363265 RepID=UPI00280370B6|nr:hypothetical protein [Leyella stercorea]MDY5553413.1 hypothetical protein [Prevotella sp.]
TPCKGKSLIIKLLPFLLWQAAKPSPGRIVYYIRHYTQGAALGYVMLGFLALASGKAERSPR